ncbi:LPS translocon maturation chaperone LptM [Erwinia sp. CGal63]|uniref:LPS translocon maturation chaperone LptM n=1 Tax=Erwinia sp. CGal63 TaxID=2919889 RepID=UPI003008F990
MKKMICRMALALAVVSLAGCGLKGPLYFPKQEQPQTGVKPAQPKSVDGAPQQSKTTDAERQSAQ